LPWPGAVAGLLFQDAYDMPLFSNLSASFSARHLSGSLNPSLRSMATKI
jgi:hypothetical protein